MSFIILPAAQVDIEHIDHWIVTNFGEAAAAKAEERLYGTFELLARFPHMGRFHTEITAKPVRFFSSPPNWIIYTPGDPLRIHRIFPAQTDIRNLTL